MRIVGCLLLVLMMQPPTNPKDPRRPTKPPIPEMVGATGSPFFLGPNPTEISFEIRQPTGPALLRSDPASMRVTLKVENVTCGLRAPNFAVYLNIPPGQSPDRHPELTAGSLGMFGLAEASHDDGTHGPNGLNFMLDITRPFALLAARKDWDRRTIRLVFVPGLWDAPIPPVQVGRVSLYLL